MAIVCRVWEWVGPWAGGVGGFGGLWRAAGAVPAGQAVVAGLAARGRGHAEMLGDAGTKDLTYKQIVDAMYPMATSVRVYSDKEMTTFVGE